MTVRTHPSIRQFVLPQSTPNTYELLRQKRRCSLPEHKKGGKNVHAHFSCRGVFDGFRCFRAGRAANSTAIASYNVLQ
jgi:hypothetical protein